MGATDRRWRALLGVLLALALVAAACGSDDDDTADDDASATETTASADDADADEDAADGDGAADDDEAMADEEAMADCSPESLETVTPGVLTSATGEPSFEPYVVDNDPTNEMGFEAAIIYEIANYLGYESSEVEWVREEFDESLAPGDKSFDLRIGQYTITAERDEVVDFSVSYYDNEQAVVAAGGSPAEGATTFADLQSARLGASIGTTSLDYIEEFIQPEAEAAVYDTFADVNAAFNAGQIDAFVTDLPTAYFLTAVEFDDASIVGILPRLAGEVDQFGFLMAEGSPVKSCVDMAIEALREAGTLESIEEEWLSGGGGIPLIAES